MRRWIAVPIILLAPLCSAGACGPGGPAPPEEELDCLSLDPPMSGAAEIVIGHPEAEPFSELTNDETLKLYYGPQGGQHFFLTVRTYAASEGEQWLLETTFTPDMPPPFPPGKTGQYFEACGAGWFEVRNFLVRVPDDRETGGELFIEASLYDAQGARLDGASTRTRVSLTAPDPI